MSRLQLHKRCRGAHCAVGTRSIVADIWHSSATVGIPRTAVVADVDVRRRFTPTLFAKDAFFTVLILLVCTCKAMATLFQRVHIALPRRPPLATGCAEWAWAYWRCCVAAGGEAAARVRMRLSQENRWLLPQCLSRVLSLSKCRQANSCS